MRFRYLFSRYGVSPTDLSGVDHPVRVGDVLILPNRSFQADISEYSSGEYDTVRFCLSSCSLDRVLSRLIDWVLC